MDNRDNNYNTLGGYLFESHVYCNKKSEKRKKKHCNNYKNSREGMLDSHTKQ